MRNSSVALPDVPSVMAWRLARGVALVGARRAALVLALVLALALVGCAGSAQPRGAAVNAPPANSGAASADAAGLRSRPASGDPGPAPAARPGSVDPAAAARAKAAAAAPRKAGDPPPLSPDTMRRYAPYAASLRNAALRDRAMERTMRTYMLITREVFRRLRGPSSTAGGKGRAATYNPVPAWRFQGRARREFRDLAARAGVLDHHLHSLQRAEVAVSAPARASGDIVVDAPGRQGRIALYRRIFRCIRADTWRRAAHGQAWVDRLLASGEPSFDETTRVRLYQQELQMMRLSVRCSTLIAQRRARD